MKLAYDGNRLAKEIRTKRLISLRLNIRDASKEIGVSAATLSRIENGKPPDIDTFANLCKWIGVPMEKFFKSKK